MISGVLDILHSGEGPQASMAWAKGCALTDDCMEVCDYGVDPRFLLAITRVALARQSSGRHDRRKHGVENFRTMADGVKILSRLKMSDGDLARPAIGLMSHALNALPDYKRGLQRAE